MGHSEIDAESWPDLVPIYKHISFCVKQFETYVKPTFTRLSQNNVPLQDSNFWSSIVKHLSDLSPFKKLDIQFRAQKYTIPTVLHTVFGMEISSKGAAVFQTLCIHTT